MKSAYGCTDGGTALYALLAAQTFLMADLFKFTLANGTILRYTSYDGDLSVMEGASPSPTGPYTYMGISTDGVPYLTRGQTRSLIGVEVDTLQVNFLTNSGVVINGIPIAQFAQQGGFDGATMELDRLFMNPATPGATTPGYLIQFVGQVAEVESTRTGILINVNSMLQLLNVQLPRNLYQAGCVHALFDTGCALVRASYASNNSVVAAGSSTTVINNTLTVPLGGSFAQGKVVFTSGVNNGLVRTIKSYATGVITLAFPLPVACGNGDTFTAYPGCDKQQATCMTFQVAPNSAPNGNLANFRGFPYIPVSEAAF